MFSIGGAGVEITDGIDLGRSNLADIGFSTTFERSFRFSQAHRSRVHPHGSERSLAYAAALFDEVRGKPHHRHAFLAHADFREARDRGRGTNREAHFAQ